MEQPANAAQLTILEASRCASSNHQCDHCAVRAQAFCAALNDGEIGDLARISRHKNYSPGEIIFDQDSQPGRIANIVSGTVKLAKLLPDGRQQIIGFLFPGDFVGHIYGHGQTSFVEAVTDVQICSFPKSELERLSERHGALNNRLFRLSVKRLEEAEQWMLLLGRKTARERVASFLMLLSARAAERGEQADRIYLTMGRADIADYVGLTIETVSRQISKLKSEQLIRLDTASEIAIPDLDELAEVADGMA